MTSMWIVRRYSAIVAALILLWMVVLGMLAVRREHTDSEKKDRLDERKLANDDTGRHPNMGTDSRPIMYTFYHRIPPNEYRGTGMSDEDDERLLLTWKFFWREAGWNPKVLTLNTSQQNPYYQELKQSLENLPFRFYDKLCFVRWLAVIQMGGGFMSDYDTFPLHDFRNDGIRLPNQGEFTVYANHVPAMVSGTSDEYFRVLKLMVENAQQHRNEQHWSDMLSLADLYHQSQGRAFHRHRDVLNGDRVLNGKSLWTEMECHFTRRKRAVHFSHKAMRKGKLGFDAKAKDRPLVARQWLKIWEKQCPYVDTIETSATDDLPPPIKSPADHVLLRYTNTISSSHVNGVEGG